MEYVWLGLFGLVVGILARWILPSRDGEGFIMTTLLGVAGSYAGGLIGREMEWGTITGWNARSIGLAVGGSLFLILVYRVIRR